MMSLVYQGPAKRSWYTVPDPLIERATDAIVRIDTTTIRVTDLHILKGDVPETKPGTILGHEAVGMAFQVGSAVSTVAKGDQVLLLPDTVRTFDGTSVPGQTGDTRWEERRDYRAARILIVEDEPDIRFMMRLIFESAGHRVTEARNGVAGLKSVQATPPDLVITDVMMPTMGGLEFIARLRSNPETAAIPILVVSGNSERATAADAVLRKPFLPKELLMAAAHLIGENGRLTWDG